MSEHVLDQPDDPVTAISRYLSSGFTAEVEASDGMVVLRLGGELDMASAPVLNRAVHTALDAGPAAISLDLSELTFVDSTGVGVFVAGHRRAASTGCAFVLHSPRRAVLRTLKLTGIDQLIDIDIDLGDSVL